MKKYERPFDPAITEAEENFLIDFQFLLQEQMTKLNISRAELAARAGVSTARLSQLLNAEANPTAKTFARLFHALGEEVTVITKRELSSYLDHNRNVDWHLDFAKDAPRSQVSESKKSKLLKALRGSEGNIHVVDAKNRTELIAA